MESKSIVYVALVAGLLLGAGAGYMIPQSSINNLSDEVESLTETVIVKEALIEESLTLIETISSDIESYESQIEDLISQKNKLNEDLDELENMHHELIINYTVLSASYVDLVAEFDDYREYYQRLWDNYNDLIQIYNNQTLISPVGELITTDISGVVNGDFEDGTEGWLFQGKGGIRWGAAYLHQYETFSTYITQTVPITSIEQGISFDVKPQPLGGTIRLRVSLDEQTVYEIAYSGINSEFNSTRITIPIKYLFEMRELYNLVPIGNLPLKFAVPSGIETGAIMIIDNVTLVSIEYQPEAPTIGELEPSFFDSFSLDTGLWEYEGTAFRDATSEYAVLIPAQRRSWGYLWLKNSLVTPFEIRFKYKSGNGERSGADGFAFLFYQKKTIEAPDWPEQTTNVVGAILSGRYSTSGYAVEFDTYQNTYDPSGNHIALRDQGINHLTYADDLRTEDFEWHNVTVEVGENYVNVILDSEHIISWTGTLDKINNAFGFGAACGEDTNWVIIDDVTITLLH